MTAADRRDIFDRVKQATVALAFKRKTPGPHNRPFEILGSGFCVDPMGLIITCRHVIEAFMEKSAEQAIADAPESEKSKPIQKLGPVQVIAPQILFFKWGSPHELHVGQVQARMILAKTDRDLAAIRIDGHELFPNGYPHIDLEDPDALYEGQEIVTCGFPLGNYLTDQIGTLTSSFTSGIISSILPAAGAPQDLIKGYQLDLTATHGNSGGPVFSLETGKAFGVLERGVLEGEKGPLLAGLTKSEPVYPLVNDGTLKKLKDQLIPKGWFHPAGISKNRCLMVG